MTGAQVNPVNARDGGGERVGSVGYLLQGRWAAQGLATTGSCDQKMYSIELVKKYFKTNKKYKKKREKKKNL